MAKLSKTSVIMLVAGLVILTSLVFSISAFATSRRVKKSLTIVEDSIVTLQHEMLSLSTDLDKNLGILNSQMSMLVEWSNNVPSVILGDINYSQDQKNKNQKIK